MIEKTALWFFEISKNGLVWVMLLLLGTVVATLGGIGASVGVVIGFLGGISYMASIMHDVLGTKKEKEETND